MPIVRKKIYNAMQGDALGDPAELCAECRRWDGVEIRVEDESVTIPNAQCTCAGGCDCYWTWVGRVEGEGDEPPALRPTKRLC